MRWPRFRGWLVVVFVLALSCPGAGQDRGKGRYESAETDGSLKAANETARAAYRGAREHGLAQAQGDRQEAILGGCEEYLEAVIRAGKVRVAGVVALVRRLRPLLD